MCARGARHTDRRLRARTEHRPVVVPLSADTFKIEFTASRATHDKLRQAQDLLRHRIPNGNLAQVFDKALDVLSFDGKTLKVTGHIKVPGGPAGIRTVEK